MLAPARPHVQLAPGLLEHPAHLFHALERGGLACCRRLGTRRAGGDKAVDALVLLAGEGADFLADLHRAEFGPAHRAEMRGLGAFRRERLVVILLGGIGIQRRGSCASRTRR